MKLSDYVNVKASSMGLSRVVNFVKEDPKTGNTVTVDTWTNYKLEKGDDALVRKETRFYRFDKTLDYNECVGAALTRAAMDYFGWTEERLQNEMGAVTAAYAEKAVEKPVESVDKVEEPKEEVKEEVKEEPKPVVKKKTRRKKKAATKKVVEVVEVVEPEIVLPEEVDEFADLVDEVVEPVEELFPFVKTNKQHTTALSKLLAEKLGREWKQNPEYKAKVSKVIKTLEETPLYTALGEPCKNYEDVIGSLLT